MSKTTWAWIGVACAGIVRAIAIAFVALLALMWGIEALGFFAQLAAGTLRIY